MANENLELAHVHRWIMHEVPEVYDGGLYFQCRECPAWHHRWPKGHYLRELASKQEWLDPKQEVTHGV